MTSGEVQGQFFPHPGGGGQVSQPTPPWQSVPVPFIHEKQIPNTSFPALAWEGPAGT